MTFALNHPPKILIGMTDALRETWDKESAEPLQGYYASTENEWKKLLQLNESWNKFRQNLKETESRELGAHLQSAYKENASLLREPIDQPGAELVRWQSRSLGVIDPVMKTFFDPARTGTSFAPSILTEGLELWQGTKSWIDRNLWVQ